MKDCLRQIESKIVYYNDMYRKGAPVVSDQVFDALLEQFERDASPADYARVRESLFSDKGDVKHQYIIGSLRKTKAEDDSVTKWFTKDNVREALAVEKLDGMSMVLNYVDGNLVMAASRGDGEYGKDYTAKVKLLPGIAKKDEYTGQIRTELVLPKTSLKKINDLGYAYKNPRNAVVGIVGSSSIDPELVKMCKIIAYQIMGSNDKKVDQYDELAVALKFDIPKHKFYVHGLPASENLKALYEKWTAESDYEIDGIVIHNMAHGDENLRLPTHTIAFKVNDLVATTTLIGKEWNMSRDKRMKPVGLIKAIELGGATIRRVTLNNAQWILDRGLRNGSMVTIEKSGDIIPKLVDAVSLATGDFDIPTYCPHCEVKLDRKGVDLICKNTTCTGADVKQINMFLRNLGVEGVSEKSFENMGLTSIDKLMKFYPRPNSHLENKLMDQLFKNVFCKTKVELICSLPFHGMSKKSVENIMSILGKKRVAHTNEPLKGISAARYASFQRQFKDLVMWVEIITHVNRWKPAAPKKVSTSPLSTKLAGMSFCFTGKLETMKRSEAELFTTSNGAEVKSVSNKLTYLVTNKPNSGSSKNKKASQLGVKLITEKQFCELIGRKYVAAADASVDQNQQDFNNL